MTEHTEPRLTADDIRKAARCAVFCADSKADEGYDGPAAQLEALANRVDAFADLLPRLWAVLDALSEADLREAVDACDGGFIRPALADRLEAAADALHALETHR